MKMMKRMFSLLLALVLVGVMLPHFAVEAEATGHSTTFTVDGLTYTATIQDFVSSMYDINKVVRVETSNVNRSGNTVTLTIEVFYTEASGGTASNTHNYTFTDSNCKNALDVNKFQDGYVAGGSLRYANFNFTRAAASHTGGMATCSKQASCERCNTLYGELNTTNCHIYYDNWFNGQVDGVWKHWKACAFNSDHQTSIGTCAVGNNGTPATCTAAATCGTCGQSFGEALGHKLKYIGENKSGTGYVITESCQNDNCNHSAEVQVTFAGQSFQYTGVAIRPNSINKVGDWIEADLALGYENNVNVGIAKAIVTIGENGHIIPFYITQAPLTVTADDKTITYGDAAPELTYTISGFVPGETAATALNGMSAIQMATTYQQGNNAGEYAIIFADGNVDKYGNYQLSYVPGTLTVNKAQPTVTAPVARELTYNGDPHALVEAGSTTVGEMHYSMSEDGTYSTDIPVGEDAGDYKVWYKAVVPENDVNYTSSTPNSVVVNIAKATPTVTPPTAKTGLVYKDAPLALIAAGQSEHGTFQYRLSENESWSTDIPTASAAGDYTVYWELLGDANHLNANGSVNVNIAKAKLTPLIGGLPADGGKVTKVYDGTTALPEGHGLSIQWDGAQGNDDIGVAGTLAYVGADAGEQTIKAALTLTGDDAANYTLTANEVSTDMGEITRLTLTKDAAIETGGTLIWSGSEKTATLSSVKMNGLVVTYTLSNNTATDVGAHKMILTGTGNFTGQLELEFYIMPNADLLRGITVSNVTSDDQQIIEKAKRMVETADTTGLPEAQKKAADDALKKVSDQAQALEKKLDDAMAATYTENVAKGLAITADNAKVSDKAALTAAKADLEEALTTYATNYTAEEKKILNNEIKRLEAIIADIATAEAAAKAVEDLPATMPPDSSAANKEKLEDAREAYDALTAAQKKIVDNSTSSKLTKLEAQVVDIDKIEGSGRWIKGSGKDLVLIFNGPHDSLKWVEVDDKVLSTKHYTVAKGSTIITFKSEYLQTLSHGRHSVVAVYEIDGQELRSNDDGESVAISVRKAASNANTGDSFNMTLWVGIAAVSVIAAIVLLVILKKKEKKQ